jgi:hypothetical protein
LFEVGTGSLLPSSDLISGNIPRISAKSENNGIIGYFSTENLESARHFENFITVNFFGVDGGVFYHPYKASVEMKVHTLKMLNNDFNSKTGIFIASALKLSLHGFGYGNQLSSSKLKNSNFKIILPIKNSKIDFEFMESFIAELEAQRIAELEAYLLTTGLKDYNLTTEETNVLQQVIDSSIQWGEFKIGDLFDICTPKKRFDANKVDIIDMGKFPYVVRTGLNNGIRGYLDEDEQFLNDGNSISFGQDTATMFYQEKPYFTGDKIKVLKSKNARFNKHNALFFILVMLKSFSSFSWGSSSFSVKIIEDRLILLPIKNGEIDFDFIELFISAIQKLVIKDVVLYADNKIELTKQIVSKQK